MRDRLENIASYTNYAVYVIVALIGIAINFWTFDKCFVMSDDAWYLCLMRDLPSGLITSAHLLFFNVFGNNIYAIRVVCYVFNIVAGGVFALGLFLYSERWLLPEKLGKSKAFIWVMLWLFVVLAGQLRVITCPSFNYITLNQIVMQVSLGLLMVSLTRNNSIAMFFSGFFIAMLIPVMITNVIAIPIIFAFIILHIYTSRDSHAQISICLSDSLKKLAIYVLGMVVFLVLYFVFVEDIKSYLSSFVEKVNETVARGEDDYGIRFLYKWLHRTMIFYFMQVVMLALVLHFTPVLAVKMNLHGKISIIFRIIMYIAVVMYIRAAVNYDINFFLWLLAFYLLLDEKNISNRKMQLFFGLLMLMPVCLSFGTNNFFKDRGYEYMSFVTPLLFVCSVRWWQKIMVSVVLVFYAVEMCMSLYSPTWHGDIYVEQKCDVRLLGIDQKLYVDEKTFDRLKFTQQYLSCGDTVWCDTENWGNVELLGLVPIAYDYRMNPNLVDSVDNVMIRQESRYSDVIKHLDSKQDYDRYCCGKFLLYKKRF